MRKEFDLQCRSPDLTISGDEKLLFVCVCVYCRPCDPGILGSYKGVEEGDVSKILELLQSQADVSFLR